VISIWRSIYSRAPSSELLISAEVAKAL
jgi:hypothetical protein